MSQKCRAREANQAVAAVTLRHYLTLTFSFAASDSRGGHEGLDLTLTPVRQETMRTNPLERRLGSVFPGFPGT